MISATIFARNAAYLGSATGPALGVRFDTQSLPAGSWVCGFLLVGPEGLTETLLPPAEERLAKEWAAALDEARAALLEQEPDTRLAEVELL